MIMWIVVEIFKTAIELMASSPQVQLVHTNQNSTGGFFNNIPIWYFGCNMFETFFLETYFESVRVEVQILNVFLYDTVKGVSSNHSFGSGGNELQNIPLNNGLFGFFGNVVLVQDVL